MSVEADDQDQLFANQSIVCVEVEDQDQHAVDNGHRGVTEQALPGSSKATPHTQPDWLEILKREFDEQIIQKCSVSTRNAVENNKLIEVVANI